MNIDAIYLEIGDLGTEQQKYLFILCVIHTYFPFHMLIYTFIGRDIKNNCECNKQNFNECIVETVRHSNEVTLSSEWFLYCSQSWLNPLTMSSFMLGLLIGSPILGSMSDRYGRKNTLFLTMAAMIVFGSISGLVSNLITYSLLRLANGFFCAGFIIALLAMTNEITGTPKRGIVNAFMSATWSLGIIILSIWSYYDPDWRSLTVNTSLSGIPLLLLYNYIPESPRWLSTNGRKQEAIKVLENIAAGNGRKLKIKPNSLEDNTELKPHDESSLNLFTSGISLRNMSIVLMLTFAINSAGYYGLTLASGSINNVDLYTATAISGAVELPASFISSYLIGKIGRTKTMDGLMFAASGALYANYLLPHESTWGPTLAFFGKMCVSGSFGVIFIIGTEIFPTTIRNSAMGFAAMFSRIGGIMAPYLAELDSISSNLHFLVFGIFLFLSAILNRIYLPETLGEPMPETLHDLKELMDRTNGRKKRHKYSKLMQNI